MLLSYVILQQQAQVQIPEPPADRISQLTDMGFSEALARNALLLHRGSIEASMEWLLEHGDDPAAAEPIPQERLQQVCVCCKQPPVPVAAEKLQLLCWSNHTACAASQTPLHLG